MIDVPGIMDVYRHGNMIMSTFRVAASVDDKGIYYFITHMIKYNLNGDAVKKMLEPALFL